jgi:hypothetical protein
MIEESILADSEGSDQEEAPEENGEPIMVPWRSPAPSPTPTVVEEVLARPLVSGQRAKRRSGLPPGTYHHFHPYHRLSSTPRLRSIPDWEDFVRDVRSGRSESSVRRSSGYDGGRERSSGSSTGSLDYSEADLSDTPRYRPSPGGSSPYA